jgi:methylated-DNA-[protein]-cysteine S-methyltransferase
MNVKPNRQLEKYLDGYPPEWRAQVLEFLDGGRRSFDVEILELAGTEFQQKVWREMMKIPFGQTRSYKQIAAAIGRPKAYRAVANACGRNPFPIIIPCHRVVATGGIGGFSLGVGLKKQLLKLESN